jgi:cytidine deaminase
MLLVKSKNNFTKGKKSMDIKAVLFDIDGVLIDSEPVIARESVAVFREFGLEVDTSIYGPYLGAGDRAFIDGMAEYYNHPLDFEKTNAAMYEAYKKAIVDEGPMAGTIDFLASLKKAGIKIALASSAPMFKIKINLKAIKKDESFFDAIISGDDITRNKPDPEIYLQAARALKVDIKECLVVEDSINGVLSGYNAGAEVLGITSSFKSIELLKLGAFATLDSFESISHFDNPEQFMEELNIMKKEKVKYGAIKCFEIGDFEEGADQFLQKALNIAAKSRLNSYSPYSNFKVGAAIVSASSNEIYGGCNVENGSYGATICAERNGILKMIGTEGPTGIKMVVVVSDDNPPAPPCALCLQVLAEFCKSDTELHLFNTSFLENKEDGVHQVFRFDELLPHPFVLKN